MSKICGKERDKMARKTYTPEQIVDKLNEVESQINRGISISEACRKIGVTDQTYYNWRKEYGGLRIDQARRLNYLKKENARMLKHLEKENVRLLNQLSKENAQLKNRVAHESLENLTLERNN
jgi:putative transposase